MQGNLIQCNSYLFWSWRNWICILIVSWKSCVLLDRVWQWHPTPVLLPRECHGWRSLVGCSPRGRWESDMTERLHFHFALSCIGEGNGSPLQCSCLENPRDGGAWWGAVYGVAQSRTRLKRLSSSSSITNHRMFLQGWYHLGPTQALWISIALSIRFESCCSQKCPQGGSTSSCPI